MFRTQSIFAAILLLTALVVAGILINQAVRDSRRAELVSAEISVINTVLTRQSVTLTAVASYTPPPTATPTPNSAATAQAEATATIVAQPALLEEALTWTPLLTDTFDNNNLNWPEDEGDTTLSTGQPLVVDGEYVWDINAIAGFTWVAAPDDAPSFTDFYGEMTLQKDAAANGELSFVFHYVDNTNFYMFGLCETPDLGYHIWYRQDGDWESIVSCLASDLIRPNQPNKLAVISQDNTYTLYINNQYTHTFRDSKFPEGRPGVMIELSAEQANTFRFDNLIIRTPNGK